MWDHIKEKCLSALGERNEGNDQAENEQLLKEDCICV